MTPGIESFVWFTTKTDNKEHSKKCAHTRTKSVQGHPAIYGCSRTLTDVNRRNVCFLVDCSQRALCAVPVTVRARVHTYAHIVDGDLNMYI